MNRLMQRDGLYMYGSSVVIQKLYPRRSSSQNTSDLDWTMIHALPLINITMFCKSQVLACLDHNELDIISILSDSSNDEEESIDEDSQLSYDSDDPSETSADKDTNMY